MKPNETFETKHARTLDLTTPEAGVKNLPDVVVIPLE